MTDPTRADPDVGAIRRVAEIDKDMAKAFSKLLCPRGSPQPDLDPILLLWLHKNATGGDFKIMPHVLGGNLDGDGYEEIFRSPAPRSPQGSARARQFEADCRFHVAAHLTMLGLLDRLEATEARATAAEKRAAELEERVFCPECQHQQKTDELMKEAAKRLRDIHGYEPGTRFISKGGKVVVVYGAALDGWIHYRLEKKSGGGSSEPAFFHEEHARLLDPAHTAETGGDRG